MLKDLINKPVSIRLKWNSDEYYGRLVSVDAYMNIQLADTIEFSAGKQSSLGMVLIRCNNVLWVGEYAPEGANVDGDASMEG